MNGPIELLCCILLAVADKAELKLVLSMALSTTSDDKSASKLGTSLLDPELALLIGTSGIWSKSIPIIEVGSLVDKAPKLLLVLLLTPVSWLTEEAKFLPFANDGRSTTDDRLALLFKSLARRLSN